MRQKLVVGVVSIAALLGLQPWADVDDQVMQLG